MSNLGSTTNCISLPQIRDINAMCVRGSTFCGVLFVFSILFFLQKGSSWLGSTMLLHFGLVWVGNHFLTFWLTHPHFHCLSLRRWFGGGEFIKCSESFCMASHHWKGGVMGYKRNTFRLVIRKYWSYFCSLVFVNC